MPGRPKGFETSDCYYTVDAAHRSLVEILKERRLALALTIRQVAQSSGVSMQAVEGWSNCRTYPGPGNFLRWCHAVGCTLRLTFPSSSRAIDDWDAVGPVLREQRRERGLYQREVASRVGCDMTAISNVERGSNGASLWTMLAVVEVLGGEFSLEVAQDEVRA